MDLYKGNLNNRIYDLRDIRRFDEIKDRILTMANDLNVHKTYKIKTLYQLLQTDKETLDPIIERLSDRDKKILYLKYGNNLDNPGRSMLTKTETSRFYNIILKCLKRGLENPNTDIYNSALTIYDYFGATKEILDPIIEKLNDKDKRIIYKRFGDKLYDPKRAILSNAESSYFYGKLVPRIQRALANLPEKEVYKGKTIYEYLNLDSERDKEFLHSILLKLNDRDRRIVYDKYGGNIDHPQKSVLTRNEVYMFSRTIMPKLRKMVIDPDFKPYNYVYKNKKTLYEILKCTKEEFQAIYEDIGDRDKELLHLKYGSDLEQSDKQVLYTEDNQEFHNHTIKHIKKLLADYRNNGNLEFSTKELFDKSEFIDLLSQYSVKDAIIISLKMGYVNNKKYSTFAIAKFFNIPEEYVIKITKEALTLYKQKISHNLTDNNKSLKLSKKTENNNS